MNSFELNKIVGGILLAILVVLSFSILSETIFEVDQPTTSGYKIDTAAVVTTMRDSKQEQESSIIPLLAGADIQAGAKVFKKCVSCHTPNEGGQNRVGPNLWNIIGKDIASKNDYKYSKVLQKLRENGVKWEFENLSKFLKKPRKYAKGTKMSFAGLKKEKNRANIIMYLRSLSNNPKPLP